MDKLGKLFDQAVAVEQAESQVPIRQFATDIAQIADSNFWLAQQGGSQEEIAAAIRQGRLAAEALEKIAAAHRQYYESMEAYLSSHVEAGQGRLASSAQGMLDVGQIYQRMVASLAENPSIHAAMQRLGDSRAAVVDRVRTVSAGIADQSQAVRHYIERASAEATRIGHEISAMPQRILSAAAQLRGDVAAAAKSVFGSAKTWLNGVRSTIGQRTDAAAEVVAGKAAAVGQRLRDIGHMGAAALAAGGALATEISERFQKHYHAQLANRMEFAATDVNVLRERLKGPMLGDIEAYEIRKGGSWQGLGDREMVLAQLKQDCLFCDPTKFLKKLDQCLWRPVDHYELIDPARLVAELDVLEKAPLPKSSAGLGM